MTVYLKGLNGRCNQVEKDVKSIQVKKDTIEIKYMKHKWGLVSGVTYSADEMEVEKIMA